MSKSHVWKPGRYLLGGVLAALYPVRVVVAILVLSFVWIYARVSGALRLTKSQRRV